MGDARKSWVGILLSVALCLGAARVAEEAPHTPRDIYNSGTARLKDGKLQEAEALLETAVASQDEKIQPEALYNLGHIRYAQGVAELKKQANAGSANNRERTALQGAEAAIHAADQALAGDDIKQLVAAYLNGRGARRELREANDAVKKAMEAFGKTLSRWQRSSGDFKSATELKPDYSDANHNAEVVDRSIAKLVDSIRKMSQAAMAAGEKNKELGEKLKQLKGRIPADQMPPGGGGEEEEEEDQPMGKMQGQKEGASRTGKEMNLSPDQAGWVLESFKLDSERRLPMGQGKPGQPRDPNRPTW